MVESVCVRACKKGPSLPTKPGCLCNLYCLYCLLNGLSYRVTLPRTVLLPLRLLFTDFLPSFLFSIMLVCNLPIAKPDEVVLVSAAVPRPSIAWTRQRAYADANTSQH